MAARRDPGPCPICGAGHTACTTDTGPAIAIPQLPSRDETPPPVEEVTFSTESYSRALHNPTALKRRK